MWTLPTPCACKNSTCIQLLMTSEFCPLILCLLVDITSYIHGLCAGNPSHLNEWLPCSSQTACTRPVLAHVHPPGDVNRSIRGLPSLRALLPTSCVQGADIMMIIDRKRDREREIEKFIIRQPPIDRNEGANLWRRQLFRNNAQKNLSVTMMSDRLVNW